MPGRDQRGAMGEGPASGRGLGRCVADWRPETSYGLGLGRGQGRSWSAGPGLSDKIAGLEQRLHELEKAKDQ